MSSILNGYLPPPDCTACVTGIRHADNATTGAEGQSFKTALRTLSMNDALELGGTGTAEESTSTDLLRYNQVSMKAAHNSYQRNESITQQITWNPQTNYNCGCGAIELDISQSHDGASWSVGHTPGYDKKAPLAGFLSDLTRWSQENPNHDVITLFLDLKLTTSQDFPNQLDAYLQTYFPVSHYSPAALMRDADTLSAGALQYGWPTLAELKNKFIICLTGDKQDKEFYASDAPTTRLCFADKDTDTDEMPAAEDRVFFNFHIYAKDSKDWMKVFSACVAKQNVIVRAYVANSSDNWNDCLQSGCNLIATDEISGHSWAEVGSNRFAQQVPLHT